MTSTATAPVAANRISTPNFSGPPFRKGRPPPPRRLERDMYDRKIAGVCSGFAKFFGMDPTVMRLIWVVLTFATGIPLIIYPICWLVMSRNDQRALPAGSYQQG